MRSRPATVWACLRRDTITHQVVPLAVVRVVLVGLAAVCPVAVAACGGGGGAATLPAHAPITHASISVGNQTRTYRLYVPPNLPANRSVPLVVVLHAALDTVDQTAAITGFDEVGTAHGAIVVYPQGVGRTWNAGICCGFALHTNVDDLGFIATLLDKLEHTYRVDHDRVYAVGVSNGAILAYSLACSMAGRFVAIASVAGTMAVGACHPAKPVSVLEIHGTHDQLVPYEGGPLYPEPKEKVPSAPAVATAWATLDYCSGTPEQTVQGPVTTQLWSPCAQTTAVRLVTIQGGTHVWYAPGLGAADGAVDATQLTASFLFQHARSGG